MALILLILISPAALGCPAQAAPAEPVIDTQGRDGTAADPDTGGKRLEPVDHNPACGPTDRVLSTPSLGGTEEQIDRRAAEAATTRMLCRRRVDAQVAGLVAACRADYGIVRGPPGTHRFRR